ncbi:uncharacterized protein LOC117872935 isoform X2 [Trachemys scripta elegans]|uniref:uncharacterized protein LOC117872935 isoform X2 n=1 Tax=Trachemys scripta elegans TaxID=31138 RepID=UPI0015577A26|nr:uncharacterized protein LOC117872935 isoform X2 [Trachemys scripta elegans]
MKSPFDCWGQSLERGATCPKSHRSIGNQQCPVWPESHTLLCLLWVSQELIEELPDNSPPGAFLANSLIAVGNLSTMTPAVEPELETHLLRAALHAVFTLAMEKDTAQVQDLPRVLPDLLDAMLGNLLADSPDTERLQYILENSAEFPRMGHHMAQLALSVSDPAKDISRQARDGVYRLYQLLLHQRDKEPSWEMAPARRVRLGPQPISLRLTPAGG